MNLNLIRSEDVNLNMGEIKHLQIIIQIQEGASRDDEEIKIKYFLAPSGAQGVAISVFPSR